MFKEVVGQELNRILEQNLMKIRGVYLSEPPPPLPLG